MRDIKRWLTLEREFHFVGESGEDYRILAHSVDGAYNIADRLFRHEPYQLESWRWTR